MDDRTRSLTYAEMAAALGMTVDSAKNLARRKRLGRQPGNDGLTRVSVPEELLLRHPPAEGAASPPVDGATAPPAEGSINLAAMAMIERHVARLEAELALLKTERDEGLAMAQSAALQVGALRATLEAVTAERDRLLTREHLRESRRFWRRLVG